MLGTDALRNAAIETALVMRRPFGQEIRATAVIKPNEHRLAHVSPRVAGKAIEAKAMLGDAVEPGQVLTLLDSLEFGAKKSDCLGFSMRSVDLGAETAGFVEVEQGLAEGERIVTGGAFVLKSELLKDEIAGED